MLNITSDKGIKKFEMEVTYSRPIEVEFKDIEIFLSENKNSNKTIFIDPIVLANQDLFLKLESLDPYLSLVPTNLHESNKNIDSLTAILSIM